MPLLDETAVFAAHKPAVAQALALLESQPDLEEVTQLLHRAYRNPRAQVVGITGPPGVGKSTLLSALINSWRGQGLTVGCIAVDPSSRRTGGALLGDRTRLVTDPMDQGIFVRSMAARDQLGGLAQLTTSACVLMRAVYDRVLLETVGVGQSETAVADLADTVVFCIQPGSGDSLQYMKAGIMEIPDIALVTKADMQALARRSVMDVQGAISLAGKVDPDWEVPVLQASAARKQGIEELLAAIESHWQYLQNQGRLAKRRSNQAQIWLHEIIRDRFGRDGLKKLADQLKLGPEQSPFLVASGIVRSTR